MKRGSPWVLLLVASSCAAAPPAPSEEEPISTHLCGGTGERYGPPGLDRVPHPPQFVDPTRPPQLLDVSLTVGGQPVKHMLPAEQAVGTPVPFYIELPPGAAIQEARLFYRMLGDAKYTMLRMDKLESGFAVEIPCRVVVLDGELKYFISLMDDQGAKVESLGSMKEPLRVRITYEMTGGPPFIPGRSPPTPCTPQ